MDHSSNFDDDYSDYELDMMQAIAMISDGTSSTPHRTPQRHRFIRRDSFEGHQHLWNDYFAEIPIYLPYLFRRSFQMSRDLFLCIHDTVVSHNDYFVQRRDASWRLGLSSLQKMTAAIRMLAYGVTADLIDEYIRIGESTAQQSMKKLVKAIVSIFGGEYLRSPNSSDIVRLLDAGQRRGFLACFFCLPGLHNDINVLDRFSVFPALAEGPAPPCNYTINGHEYTMGYYLVNVTYPSWATLVKKIPSPQGNKKKHFAACQESTRKDVERAFGVLQGRFAIVHRPARFFRPEVLKDIMYACISLHNMIVEEEWHLYFEAKQFIYKQTKETPNEPISRDNIPEFIEFIAQHHQIRDKDTHSQLQADLIDHLWNIHGRT
ncbi:uncharacterized protein LOC121240881 [Juglans microcarpa x Juglans regia]|uniref:uncharacterized protein LOC121240881 n=1 Tax=Juglans microcarpa x Juglans regia TaxID=2249226 RepID=UPI001B7DF274|nr:uncharacterized protein LOC121240881 [Juglans microcarpa x Juglans regia]